MDGTPILDTIPPELLHRIASFLPVSSILKLCLVNHKLYATCYDSLVFKWSASNEIYEHEHEHDRLPEARSIRERYIKWPEASVFDRLSVADGARIAYAVEKARLFFGAEYQIKDWRSRWEEESFGNWVPHLIALRHPSCLQLKPETLQMILWQPNARTKYDPMRNPIMADYITVGFSMVAFMLLRMEDIPNGYSSIFESAVQQPFEELYPHSTLVEDMNWRFEDIHNVDGLRDTIHFTDRYMLILCMIFLTYPFKEHQDARYPSLHRIPLASFFSNPIPFRTPAEVFNQCHLSAIQIVQYLSGEWTGWHADARWLAGSLIAPPVKNIHLSAREANDSDFASDAVVIIENDSRGEDYLGQFTFGGHVTAEGEVLMLKTYLVQNHDTRGPYQFRGMVTPFGISGYWILNRHNFSPERFWWWKMEWCNP